MNKQLKSFDSALLKEIRGLILAARNAVIRNIDSVQVMTSYEIGRRIVEHEQKGASRAQYGKKLLVILSVRLTAEFGIGFSERNLRNMRRFYLVYQDRSEQIRQTSSAKLTHQDLGQMQMYVNYFDRYVRTKGEESTIGIVLCRKNREVLVEITLPKDANIHAKEYCLYLPSKEELRQKLVGRSRPSFEPSQ